MIKKYFEKFVVFIQKYSGKTHAFLIGWNLIVTAWATGGSVSLEDFGIPYSINIREVVVYIQAHIHLPTWVIGTVTFLVNITIAYAAWKKNHVKTVDVAPGDVIVASPTVNDDKTEEKLEVAVVDKPKTE